MLENRLIKVQEKIFKECYTQIDYINDQHSSSKTDVELDNLMVYLSKWKDLNVKLDQLISYTGQLFSKSIFVHKLMPCF